MTILVSACLLGENCKYNGGNNLCAGLADAIKGHRGIPVCPEVLGGLPTPRPSCELVDGIVTDSNGISRHAEFCRGAEIALNIAKEEHADIAILQSRSPSCGVNEVYDGSFSGKKIPGHGVFADLLKKNGIRTVDIADFPTFFAELK